MNPLEIAMLTARKHAAHTGLLLGFLLIVIVVLAVIIYKRHQKKNELRGTKSILPATEFEVVPATGTA